jgi:AAA15 family ATPase/GTPase
MKIKTLNIYSHKHLQDLNFDFTYPEGHDGFGQPLKKVCIIGQSATGKTSILEIIRNSIINLQSLEILNNNYLFTIPASFKGELEVLINEGTIKISENAVTKNEKKFSTLPGGGGGTLSSLIEEAVKLLYFSAEILSVETIKILDQNPIELNTIVSEKKVNIRPTDENASYTYQFGVDTDAEKWLELLSRILDYRKRFTQFASELINKGTLADPGRLNDEYVKWSKNNLNPVISFANSINPVLNKLGLEIDLINTEYFIPITLKNKVGVIPFTGLSTGTKGLLLSMFPLFELDTNEAVILMDEPERSLFPDVQIELFSYYQRLAPNAQFIVATHSPFIAAAFEPEERFVLYFDKEGNVAVRRGQSPIGDDPNDMLRNDFNVEYYNNFGKEAYQRYLDLKKKVAKETEPQKKKELIVEMAELGDKYNF